MHSVDAHPSTATAVQGGPATGGNLKEITRLQHAPRVLRVVGQDERHRAPIAGPQRAVAARVDGVRSRWPAQGGHLRQVAQQPGRPCTCTEGGTGLYVRSSGQLPWPAVCSEVCLRLDFHAV